MPDDFRRIIRPVAKANRRKSNLIDFSNFRSSFFVFVSEYPIYYHSKGGSYVLSGDISSFTK